MKKSFPLDEASRLQALRQYQVLDTVPEQEFDDLTHLAAQICGTPISAITLIDQNRQWFKARVGLDIAETPREVSICAHTILGSDILIVPDATANHQFAGNPFVIAEPYVRFYAGVPLITPEGQAVGSLCVIDIVPRELDQEQQDALRRLGRQVMALLEARPEVTTGKKQSRQTRQQTEQKRLALAAEQKQHDADKLKASEERYRRLFEAAQDGILILDVATGQIEDANPFLCQLLGYAQDELVGKQLWSIGAFRDIPANQDVLHTLQEREYLRYGDLPVETKDGQSIAVEFVCNVYLSDGKKVIQCNIRDISAHKRAVTEQERFFTLSLDMLCILDKNGYFRRLNPAFEKILGFTVMELTGDLALDYLHPDDRSSSEQALEQIATGHPVNDFVNRFRCRDGSYKSILWTTAPYDDHFYAAGRDITERKQAEDALREAHGQLETRVQERTAELVAATKMAEGANLAKSEFLSRMSHELRTPLNAILGFGQILEQHQLPQRSTESIGHVLKGGRHLLGLINEILDLSRVEAGHIELSLESIDLMSVVPEACAMMHPLAAERNISLYDGTAGLRSTCIIADLQRFQQVLLNLLSNAIKYNREGGHVEISCTVQTDGWTSIVVRDTGPGILPEDLPKIFIPFERLNALNSGIEGTGLGLALSQRLVIAMNGTLTVESILKQGTTFTIKMPQATCSREPLAHTLEDSHPLLTAGREYERTHSVLCIEDNPSNLRLIETIFEARPEWKLWTATRGNTGLDMAWQHEPDLILLDVNLPDIDGNEVLARLRQSVVTRDIPVVVISADATLKRKERLLNAGATAYLTKPLDIIHFLQTLDQFLSVAPVLKC